MRIGIIGAGHIGTTLSRHFAVVGHNVSLCGLLVPKTVRAVADFADVVVISVPFRRFPELPIGELAGKPVIDTTNYDPDQDGPLRPLDEDRITSSELIQAHLARSHVTKAFNAICWADLRDQAFRDLQRAIPVSGDDANAKKATMALIAEIGFDPVDVGGLADGGRKHQPGSDIYAADLTSTGLRWRLHMP